MEENKYRKETKYYCNYCKIFVQNNKISKTTHESDFRHKNAVARFLRSVHKTQDRQAFEKTKNDKMLLQIEEKARRAVGMSTNSLASSSSVTPVPRKDLNLIGAGSKGKINPDLYGYGTFYDGGVNQQPAASLPFVPFHFDPNEFKVTEAFKEANIPTIGVGKIGEWETFTETIAATENNRDQDDNDNDNDESATIIPVKKSEMNEFLDEEEGVSKADVQKFKIKEKRMIEEDHCDDQSGEEDIGFKKRKVKGNNARKKLI